MVRIDPQRNDIGISLQSVKNDLNNKKLSEAMESIEKWTEDVTDKYVQDYANKAIERINAGDDYDDILEDYEKMSEKEAKKAAFRSKNQMANLTSMTTRVRAQSAGIKAIWRMQKDPKVRDRHAILEGVEFDLDKGARNMKILTAMTVK